MEQNRRTSSHPKPRKPGAKAIAFALSCAFACVLVLGACEGGAGGPGDGGSGGGSGGGTLNGTIWVLGSDNPLIPNGISVVNLQTGKIDTTLPLTRPASSIVLTTAHAWVTLNRRYLVRVRRADYSIDSVDVSAPGDTNAALGALDADDAHAFVATGNSARLVQVDAAALTVTRAIQASTINNKISRILMHQGFAYVLIDNGFSLVKVDPTSGTPVATVNLGEDPNDPNGPRSNKYGYGDFAVAGNRALVVDRYKKKLIRLNLDGPAVDSVFNPGWVAGVGGGPLFALGESALLPMEDSLKIRKISLVSLARQADLPLRDELNEFTLREDGLMAFKYIGAFGRIGFARVSTMDTLSSIAGPLRNSGIALAP